MQLKLADNALWWSTILTATTTNNNGGITSLLCNANQEDNLMSPKPSWLAPVVDTSFQLEIAGGHENNGECIPHLDEEHKKREAIKSSISLLSPSSAKPSRLKPDVGVLLPPKEPEAKISLPLRKIRRWQFNWPHDGGSLASPSSSSFEGPDIGVLKSFHCDNSQVCIEDVSSSLGGRCVSKKESGKRNKSRKAKTMNAINNMQSEGKLRSSTKNTLKNNRNLYFDCPSTCNDEFCDCMVLPRPFDLSCASIASDLCIGDNVASCYPYIADTFEQLKCPVYTCLTSGKSNIECSCVELGSNCEYLTDIGNAGAQYYCQKTECCNRATTDTERYACVYGNASLAPSPSATFNDPICSNEVYDCFDALGFGIKTQECNRFFADLCRSSSQCKNTFFGTSEFSFDCTVFTCYDEGGSYEECFCKAFTELCAFDGNLLQNDSCKVSACCGWGTTDEERAPCLNGNIYFPTSSPIKSSIAPTFPSGMEDTSVAPQRSGSKVPTMSPTPGPSMEKPASSSVPTISPTPGPSMEKPASSSAPTISPTPGPSIETPASSSVPTFLSVSSTKAPSAFPEVVIGGNATASPTTMVKSPTGMPQSGSILVSDPPASGSNDTQSPSAIDVNTGSPTLGPVSSMINASTSPTMSPTFANSAAPVVTDLPTSSSPKTGISLIALIPVVWGIYKSFSVL